MASHPPKHRQSVLASYSAANNESAKCPNCMHTRFVALWRAQIESPISTLSPSEYGNELPLAIADATADLRKSIAIKRRTISFNGERERRVTGKRVLALKWQRGPGCRIISGWD